MKLGNVLWPLVGAGAVAVSGWILWQELQTISLADVTGHLRAITPWHWAAAFAATVLAYAALAGYDRIALRHLGKTVPWRFIALCSFTTYALAHNIGASVFSGAVVRYRAYSSRGLTASEIGILVALCSFTFGLGTVLLGGVVLILRPDLGARFVPGMPDGASLALGAGMLALIALYVLGSWLHFKPLRLRRVEIFYPRLPVVGRQLLVGPLELIGAAGIIHFALPDAGHPGFLVILGIFLASFTIALLSHAPGGIGVLEAVFLLRLPEMDPAGVLAALLVFRLLYLLIPFALSLVVVLAFERAQIKAWMGGKRAPATPPAD